MRKQAPQSEDVLLNPLSICTIDLSLKIFLTFFRYPFPQTHPTSGRARRGLTRSTAPTRRTVAVSARVPASDRPCWRTGNGACSKRPDKGSSPRRAARIERASDVWLDHLPVPDCQPIPSILHQSDINDQGKSVALAPSVLSLILPPSLSVLDEVFRRLCLIYLAFACDHVAFDR